MKAIALVPAAVAAILACNISSASSQAACAKEYQACMNSCATRSSKQIQDGCFQGCEGKNNVCAEGVYGKRPLNGGPATAADQNGEGRDALAKTGQPQEAAQAQDAAKEQVAEQQPQQKPAPRQQTMQKSPHRALAKH